MRINFTRRTLVAQLALLTLIAAYLVQLPTQATTTSTTAAQSSNLGDDGLITFWDLNSIGLALDESLIATLYNATEPGQSARQLTVGEPVVFTMTISNPSGDVILERNLEIPANQFRSTCVTYDEQPIAGEPGTGRKPVGLRNQIRTPPLWGRGQRAVATLELVGADGRTRVAWADPLGKYLTLRPARP
jgi:hypothetical protein